MTDNIAQRDRFVADQLRRLEVPAAGPDFWDTLAAGLGGEPEQRSAISDDPNPVVPIGRSRTTGRGTWLAAAAAVIVAVGGLGAALAIVNSNAGVMLDSAGDVITGEDGDGTDIASDDADPVDVVEPSRFDIVRSVDLLGVGSVVDQTQLPDAGLVVREMPDSEGRGCAGDDPLLTVDRLTVDGVASASGLDSLVWPRVHVGPSGRVVAISECDGLTTVAVGDLGADGVIAMPSKATTAPDLNLIGEPVWFHDETGFTISAGTDSGFQSVVFDATGTVVTTEPSAGIVLARLDDGREVELQGSDITVAGTALVATDLSVIPGAVENPAGSSVAVHGGHGVAVVGDEFADGQLVYDRSVIDAAFSPLGDLALITGPEDRQLIVIDLGTGNGTARSIDTGLEGLVPDGITWTEGGSSLMVSGSNADVSDSVWLIRFGADDGGSDVEDGELMPPTDSGNDSTNDESPESVPAETGADREGDSEPVDVNAPILGSIVDPGVVGDDRSLVDFDGVDHYAYEDVDRGVISYVGSDRTIRDVVQMAPGGNVDNQLVGLLIMYDSAVHVLYERIEFEPGNSPAGVTTLIADDLDPSTPAHTLESRVITGVDGSWMYTNRVEWGDRVLWLERSFNQGACYWIDTIDLDGNVVDTLENPWPRPEVDLNALSAAYTAGESNNELTAACPSESPLFD